jgi:hypothetical protein
VASVFVGNTNSFRLVGLTDRHDQLVTDAVPTFVIVDKQGAVVTPEWQMDPIADEPGNYRGFILSDTPLTAGRKYFIKLDVDLGDGSSAHFEMPFTAETRTA